MDVSASRIVNVPLALHGSALVLIGDDRDALKAMLLLQEFGITVDLTEDEAAALGWARRADYQLIVCGGAPKHNLLTMRLHRAAPRARVVYLSRETAPRSFEVGGIETFQLPLDVNEFVEFARLR